MATEQRNSALQASCLVAEALDANKLDHAYRGVLQLSNDLASASSSRLRMLVAEPPNWLPPGWDAFLAAVVEWRALQAGVDPPGWSVATIDSTSAPWTPPGALLKARAEYIPIPFRRRNVLIEEGELGST